MKNGQGYRNQDDFIAPARRAFRRTARRLRAANTKLGFPLVFGEKGCVRFVETEQGNYTINSAEKPLPTQAVVKPAGVAKKSARF